MNTRIKFFLIPIIALVLMSCNLLAPGGPAGAEPTPDLALTLTALVSTSQASVPTATNTQVGQPSPFPSATQAATTVPVVGITPLAPPATRPAPTAVTRCNWAQFQGDVTVPDGTEFTPGKSFTKKWRLKNIGTCTWGQGYHLIFSGGSGMDGMATVALPAVVNPGGTVDAEVTLTAPANPGSYTGYWKLANANGEIFGIGADAQSAFYVNIKVIPIPTQSVGLTRINFRSYATGAVVEGNSAGGHPPQYILGVMSGQVMMVDIDSPNQDFYFRIYGYNTGAALVDKNAEKSSWQGRVPATQDYVIETFTHGDNQFTLSVTIPERIAFQPGAISATVTGPLRPRETHTYILRASAGQTMSLDLTPSDQSVLLAVYGYDDGQPLLRTAAGETSWSGELPETQDYIIQVVSVIGSDTTYSLYTEIE